MFRQHLVPFKSKNLKNSWSFNLAIKARCPGGGTGSKLQWSVSQHDVSMPFTAALPLPVVAGCAHSTRCLI